MNVQSFSRNLSTLTLLAFRLEDHLLWLRAELKQVELVGATSEVAALHGAIGEVQRLLKGFVY